MTNRFVGTGNNEQRRINRNFGVRSWVEIGMEPGGMGVAAEPGLFAKAQVALPLNAQQAFAAISD